MYGTRPVDSLMQFLRLSPFWDVTRWWLAFVYRHKEAAYRWRVRQFSHFKWDWYVVSKRRQTTTKSCVASQKSDGLNYSAAEAWNLAIQFRHYVNTFIKCKRSVGTVSWARHLRFVSRQIINTTTRQLLVNINKYSDNEKLLSYIWLVWHIRYKMYRPTSKNFFTKIN